MKQRRVHAALLLLVMVTLVCSQFGLSQTRHRAPATKPSPGPKSEAASGPSLQETLNWLKGVITGNGGYSSFGDVTVSLKYESFRFEGCRVVLNSKRERISDNSTWETTYVDTASLGDFDPSGVQVKKSIGLENVFLVGLQTSSGQKTVHEQIDGTIEGCSDCPRHNHDQADRNGLAILFGDEDLANRVAKAFAHAITLCGGKKSPF